MDYRTTVVEFARRLMSKEFSNGTPDNAAAIVEAMLLTARGSFKMYTGDFSSDFFGRPDITNALDDFFKRKAFPTIKILVKNGVDKNTISNHPWVNIANKHGGTMEIRSATGNYSTDEVKPFSVVDMTGYRYEHDRGVSAVANFYDPKIAASLDVVFEEAFSYWK
jgi:hypothetical protein